MHFVEYVSHLEGYHQPRCSVSAAGVPFQTVRNTDPSREAQNDLHGILRYDPRFKVQLCVIEQPVYLMRVAPL